MYQKNTNDQFVKASLMLNNVNAMTGQPKLRAPRNSLSAL